MPKLNEIGNKAGPIEEKKVEEIRTSPFNLIENFDWCEINLENNEEMD